MIFLQLNLMWYSNIWSAYVFLASITTILDFCTFILKEQWSQSCHSFSIWGHFSSCCWKCGHMYNVISSSPGCSSQLLNKRNTHYSHIILTTFKIIVICSYLLGNTGRVNLRALERTLYLWRYHDFYIKC